jgi:undecaprenyl pyrophosphate phosphatase UppP
VKPADPYAVVNHPLQPRVQHLHILLAPLLVFTAGLIWRRHVWSQVKRGMEEGRRSGLTLIFLLVPMIVSGYLIQTAVDDAWRRIWVNVHLVTSGLWLLSYLAHQAPVVWRRRASSGPPGTSDSPPEAERPSPTP